MSKSFLTSSLDTPLGPMIAIADESFLYLLDFKDCKKFDRQFQRIRQVYKVDVVPGTPKPILSIDNELKQYFAGSLKHFETPIIYTGTPFQKSVWDKLKQIPFGQTISYGQLATSIGKPRAFRAAAGANGANFFPIVVPCHRVINSNGTLGGYSGGLNNKISLLEHEQARFKL